jgi:hypothetical protein
LMLHCVQQLTQDTDQLIQGLGLLVESATSLLAKKFKEE